MLKMMGLCTLFLAASILWFPASHAKVESKPKVMEVRIKRSEKIQLPRTQVIAKYLGIVHEDVAEGPAVSVPVVHFSRVTGISQEFSFEHGARFYIDRLEVSLVRFDELTATLSLHMISKIPSGVSVLP